jgi:anthranilate synthase component 2
MRILLIDNYDSFTYNLVHLIEKVCEIKVDVKRNNEITLNEVDEYERIVLSPGPGVPSEAGVLLDVIKQYASTKNIFGVCLGLQAVGEAFGANLKNLKNVFHGISTPVIIKSEQDIFKNCPKEFKVGRYHSWVVDGNNLPSNLHITAVDEQGEIMALKHTKFNVRGVQFHPESILSEHGELIFKNWLEA